MNEDAKKQHQRLVMRCITGLLLNETGRLLRRHEGSFGRAIVFLAISQASKGANATISVRAIAQSLAIPYETVRRHAHHLVAQGLCAGDGEVGFYVPEAVLDAEAVSPAARESFEDVVEMIAALKGLGLDFAQFERASGLAPGMALSSAGCVLEAGRWSKAVIESYHLRLLEFGIPAHGQALDAILFVALIDLTTGAITNDPMLAWRYASAEAPPPDALMQPATIAQIAKRVHLPYETTRRRIERLAKLGRCRRVEGGYLADRPFMESPVVMQTGLLCAQRTAQLVQQLRAGGLDIDALPSRRQAEVA